MFGIRIEKTTDGETAVLTWSKGRWWWTKGWIRNCQGNIDLNWYEYKSIKNDERVVYA